MKCILLMWSANKVFIFPTNTSENKPFVIWCKEIKTIANEAQSAILKAKGEGSPYSITERRVPELIPVLCSQPAGVMSHKPGGRLTLLSARPVVTSAILKRAATNFAAWWTGARWVWTVCLRLLPDSVATAIWTRAFCTWVQHANHSATEPPLCDTICNKCHYKKITKTQWLSKNNDSKQLKACLAVNICQQIIRIFLYMEP